MQWQLVKDVDVPLKVAKKVAHDAAAFLDSVSRDRPWKDLEAPLASYVDNMQNKKEDRK